MADTMLVVEGIRPSRKLLNKKGDQKMLSMKKAIAATALAAALCMSAVGGAFAASGAESAPSVDKLEAIDGAKWIGKNKLLLSKVNDEGRADYIVDATTGAHELLLQSANTSELAVSPDGAKAAYTEIGRAHV